MQIRTQRIQQALAALPPSHETARVPWRGQLKTMSVVRLPLEVVVLNSRSHRIRAQLESMPEAMRAIEEDPYSQMAQDHIASLLRATPGFEALKQNLEHEGQKDYGIITTTGLLVNANTRAVALRDLGHEYIEVAVLPPDASIGEIYDLELELQVAETYKQDYSFTNQLLFVDDLISEQDLNEREVALRLRWARPTDQTSIRFGEAKVQRYVRHLSLIRDIQMMSGDKVLITKFDDAEQALQEFDTAYEGLRNRDPVSADRLRQARTLGLLVNLGYERQRQVDASWVETYLAEAFSESPVLASLVAGSNEIQDEDGSNNGDDADLFGDQGGDIVLNEEALVHQVVATLVDRLAKSAKEEVVRLPTAEGEKTFDRGQVTAAINDAMRNAAEDAKSAARAGNDLKLPAVLVEEAVKKLVRARTALTRVATREDFDPSSVLEKVSAAERAIEALQIELSE